MRCSPAEAESALVHGCVYWPYFFMACTIVIATAYELDGRTDMMTRTSRMLTSPWPLGCVGATVALHFLCFARSRGLARAAWTERMAAVWHLTNATWWSFGCDVLAGLFGVMPNINRLYEVLDTTHLEPSAGRAGLDACYWVELCVHVPFSLLVFGLYCKRAPERYIVEAFVCGAQTVGTVAYYLPEVLRGGEHWCWDRPLIFAVGIAIAPLLWIVLPLVLLARAVRVTKLLMAEAETHRLMKAE